MSRDIIINGETLVKVKGNNNAILGGPFGTISTLQELGLTDPQGEVRIAPRFVHRDIFTDDYGTEIPAEVLWFLADVNITMTLVQFDLKVLDACISEAMGGGGGTGINVGNFPDGTPAFAGALASAGLPMGGGLPVTIAGCHYVSLNILSAELGYPYRFPSSYLADRPEVRKLGTKRSMVELNWRAIPYGGFGVYSRTGTAARNTTGEVTSEGKILWDHTLDT